MAVERILKIRKPNPSKHTVEVTDGSSFNIAVFEPDFSSIIEPVFGSSAGSSADIEIEGESLKPPVVVLFPAMGVRASFYKSLAEKFNKENIISIVCDLRGVGSSSLRPSKKVDFSYYDIVSKDYPAAMREVRLRYPENPIYLFGHSLGGQLSLLYAATHEEKIDGIILAASGSVYYKSYRFPSNLKTIVGTQMAWGAAYLLGSFPGDKFNFGGQQPYSVIRDWAHQGRTGRYHFPEAPYDVESALETLDVPILSINIKDDWLAPQSATAHLCDKAPQSQVEYWLYKDKKVDHFNWVRHNEPVVEKCIEWMEKTYQTAH